VTRDESLLSCFETQSLPSLLRCYLRSFTFYLGNSLSSIPGFLISFLRVFVSCVVKNHLNKGRDAAYPSNTE
jgi:hypothetical protein